MLSELEINARGLNEDLHPLPGSRCSHRKLWYWFQLSCQDAEGSHGLRGDHIRKGVAAIDKGCCRKVPQLDGDIGAVVLVLTGLEVDLRMSGGGHCCKMKEDFSTGLGGRW